MEFRHITLAECSNTTGTIVVIDVLRAFTTAAFALAAGAQDILLVSTVEEAFQWRAQTPGALVMGEVAGLAVPGFDFNNSPTELLPQDLTGRRMIHRTSAGTQGMVRSVQAEHLFGGSFVCAGATARAVHRLAPRRVSFVITGIYPDRNGDEDAACADYMQALLSGENPDPAPYLRRVYESTTGRWFLDPARPEFPLSDLEYATEVDRFDFAMQVQRQDGLLLMKALP